MEASDIIIALLIVLLLFFLFGHLLVINTNIAQPQQTIPTTVKKIYIPVPYPQQPQPQPQPQHQPNLIGGCAGTQYGCCPDNKTARTSANGLNCIQL